MALIRLLPSYRDCYYPAPFFKPEKTFEKLYLQTRQSHWHRGVFAHANISAKSRPVAVAQEQEAQMG